MLWIINGLLYGFFTALYTLVNQRHKFNGYVLGIWRGFGVALIFMPFLLFLPPQTDAFVWALLIFQGWMIGIYDSHLFFASARFGAGATSRMMALSAPVTALLWWALTPKLFFDLFSNGNVFITILLTLFGFTFCYWQMIKIPLNRKIVEYVAPAIFALAGMSIAAKEIAMLGENVWINIVYYLAVAAFVSGCYNTICYLKSEKPTRQDFFNTVFDRRLIAVSAYIISFSAALITSKTMAMRLAPNPGYVVALVLTAPLFVFFLNKYRRIPDNISVKAGFSMLFFLILLMLLVTGNWGVAD